MKNDWSRLLASLESRNEKLEPALAKPPDPVPKIRNSLKSWDPRDPDHPRHLPTFPRSRAPL